MERRRLLEGALAAPLLSALPGPMAARAAAAGARLRPGDPGFPGAAAWERLGKAVGGRLVALRSPLEPCRADPQGADCAALFRGLKNPYFIGDDPALTQTCGWIDAWTAQPSLYAVAAESAADVAAAVDFARTNNIRLVVRGGAHSYLGTSSAPDSLMIWTRRMSAIELHDGFVGQGCAGIQAPMPAVSLGAGAIWMHAYDAVTTKGGRYVQGGGCGTVGVTGLVLGGGFGSYSRQYGTAASSLLEAEIVTADGAVRIANAATNPELFWALKGGGGGSFGAVTRLTLRTHALPEFFGIVATTIVAASDAAYRRLLGRYVAFHAEMLCNPNWGEIVTLRPGNRLDIRMEFQGIDEAQARAIWQPLLQWVAGERDDYSFTLAPVIRAAPARDRWDPAFFAANAPNAVRHDDRPGAPEGNIFWSANLSETGHFIHGFESAWLPASLLRADRQGALADALMAASRIWSVELHFQKGLAGGAEAAIGAARDTATNPAVCDAFALAIVAGEGPPGFPGLAGHAPDLPAARRHAAEIRRAMAALRAVAPASGAYVAESSYFERDWQASYWGANYPRLLAAKRRYDPDGLFFARHGVGSEEWSEDGFTRLASATP